MPVCPSCGVEYRPGFTRCADCDVELVDRPIPAEAVDETEWVAVYTGRGVELDLVQGDLEGLGLTVVRTPADSLEAIPVGLGTSGLTYYTLSIPEEQYRDREVEVKSAVAECTGRLAAAAAPGAPAGEAQPAPALQADAAAEAEAEEDYDVRACPACRLFFHENYAVCPGCGSELVPAVECFAPEQTEPDRVIVRDGTPDEMKTLESRLRAGGFDAQAVSVEGWPVAAVDLSWSELTDRTAQAEALLAAAG